MVPVRYFCATTKTSGSRLGTALINVTAVDGQRILLLMRHAKSGYPPGVTDHDRPLAPRGVKQAGLAGDWLRANVPPIDGVLCSTATRARQTVENTRIDVPVRYSDRLYDATPGIMIDEINTVGAGVSTLLVVGHEPTMSALALGLAGNGSDPAVAERISAKFPTSAIAVLTVPCLWTDLELGRAALIGFGVPR